MRNNKKDNNIIREKRGLAFACAKKRERVAHAGGKSSRMNS
jgi:hypothetical protein